MPYSRPATYPDFCLTGTRTAPSGSEINTGYQPDQIPPCEEHNWLFGFIGDWVRWLDQTTQSPVRNVVAVSHAQSPYTVVGNNYFLEVDASAGNVQINLPALSLSQGQELKIKKIDSSGNTVTVSANGVDTIDTQTSQVINADETSLNMIGGIAQWNLT